MSPCSSLLTDLPIRLNDHDDVNHAIADVPEKGEKEGLILAYGCGDQGTFCLQATQNEQYSELSL